MWAERRRKECVWHHQSCTSVSPLSAFTEEKVTLSSSAQSGPVLMLLELWRKQKSQAVGGQDLWLWSSTCQQDMSAQWDLLVSALSLSSSNFPVTTLSLCYTDQERQSVWPWTEEMTLTASVPGGVVWGEGEPLCDCALHAAAAWWWVRKCFDQLTPPSQNPRTWICISNLFYKSALYAVLATSFVHLRPNSASVSNDF